MHLLAPTTLRIAPAELPGLVRTRFAADLRRAGSFAQLGMLGAQSCLDAAGGNGRLGVVWSSPLGALRAFRAAFDDDLRHDAPVMPFTFIGMQPHLAAALLAQRYPVARSAHLHLAPDAWPWLLRIAQGWLATCDRVLVGSVEESGDDALAHRSDWCLVQDLAAAGSVRAEPAHDPAAATGTTTSATMADWIGRIHNWRADARAPLELAGGGEAWRFGIPD
jgi:hypothetical protein